MIEPSTADSVLRAARRGGADFAEIYAERWRRRQMRVLDGAVAEATSGIEYGAGIRLLFGTDVVYAYTNDLAGPALERLVADSGAASAAEQERARVAWRRAADRTPHGHPIELRPSDYPG